ncbi:protein NLP7-like [Bidens hawaiensis]|uniref:protein NLP7-like n=1 Tax=Bidens hawaiensis TaxID=980011 RepID=UPI00404B0ABE
MIQCVRVNKFLEWFSPISLDYKAPEFGNNPWVFWKQNEGSEINNNNSSSAAAAADLEIHDRIISAFSNNCNFFWALAFAQFWAPVTTIGGRQLLSTSGQPFAVLDDSNEMAKYRIYTEKYKYNIDMNYKPDIEEADHTIISGGPATAFLNRLPYFTQLQWIQAEFFRYRRRLNYSVMLPICFPSQSTCIGVLEFTFHREHFVVGNVVLRTIRALNEAGLDVIPVQDLITYTVRLTNMINRLSAISSFVLQNIKGLKLAKEEIKEALKVVCESHNLALAQVWMDKSRVLSSSSLEDTQTKQLSAVKLTGYRNALEHSCFDDYFRLCDVIPYGITEEFARETLQDYKSRYFSKFHSDMVDDYKTCALTVCLRSNDTGDLDYVFEFVWKIKSNYVKLLKAIILALKRCLPRFKFASGVALGNELDVIFAQSDTQSKTGESEIFKIFQGKRSSPKPKVPSNLVCKTTPKVLTLEDIQKQFGNTMKEAAANLNVHVSTLKRKLKEHGITELPGPNYMKRKANDSSIVQIDTNEEDNGAIQESSTIRIDQNTLTIKAELEGDMIKFSLSVLEDIFLTVEKEIGRRFNLCHGTYKLKYRDGGDWILLRSDEEMDYCIESSRKSDAVRLLVVRLSTQPVYGPSCSIGIYFNQ